MWTGCTLIDTRRRNAPALCRTGIFSLGICQLVPICSPSRTGCNTSPCCCCHSVHRVCFHEPGHICLQRWRTEATWAIRGGIGESSTQRKTRAHSWTCNQRTASAKVNVGIPVFLCADLAGQAPRVIRRVEVAFRLDPVEYYICGRAAQAEA